jgi:hypothetical protein
MKKKYSGVLAQPLEPMGVGVLSSSDQIDAAVKKRVETEFAKLVHLLSHYAIEGSENCWLNLALALARDHVPGFKEATIRHRPKTWGPGELWMLAGDFLRERNEGASSNAEAARRLARKEPWVSFLNRGRWKQGKAAGPSDAERLLQQYNTMPDRHRKVGEDAFRYHSEVTGTIDQWIEETKLILNPRRR